MNKSASHVVGNIFKNIWLSLLLASGCSERWQGGGYQPSHIPGPPVERRVVHHHHRPLPLPSYALLHTNITAVRNTMDITNSYQDSKSYPEVEGGGAGGVILPPRLGVQRWGWGCRGRRRRGCFGLVEDEAVRGGLKLIL